MTMSAEKNLPPQGFVQPRPKATAEHEEPQRRVFVDQQHLIVISTTSPAASLEAITHALPHIGGRVRALSLKPVGSRFEATLRLYGEGVVPAPTGGPPDRVLAERRNSAG